MNDMTMILIFALILCLLAALCVSSCSGNGEDETTRPQTTDGDTTTAEYFEITTEAPETTTAEAVTVTLRVATYNIKHGADAGLDMTIIGNIIKNANLDIVGLQEVDYLTNRSNKLDEPALIAAAADMPYYNFARSIDYSGGQYGTLILSKYPITKFTVHALDSGTHEKRSLGHAVINVNGISVDFFNTHLSYEDTATRLGQFVQILDYLDGCKYFIVTGDFNTQDFTEVNMLGAPLLINRNTSRHVTYPSSSSAIDNIVLSDGFREISAGTVDQSYSDHRMLWAELELTGIPD